MLNTTLNGRGRGIHSLPLVLPHSNDRMTGWPNSNGVCFEKYCALHIFKSKFQQSFPFKLQSCVDSLRNEKWRGFWTWKRTIRTLPLTNSGVIHGEQEGAMYPWIGDSDFGIKVLMVTHFLPRCLILLTWLLGVTNCMASEQTLLHHKVLKIASVADAHSSKMLRTKALDTLITTPTSTTLPKELGGGGVWGSKHTFESIAKVNKVPSLRESSNLIYPPFSLSTGISPFGNLQQFIFFHRGSINKQQLLFTNLISFLFVSSSSSSAFLFFSLLRTWSRICESNSCSLIFYK